MTFAERFCQGFARLPLRWAHAVGALLGWAAYTSPRYRARLRAHAALAGLSPAQIRAAVAHGGRTIAELPRIWFGCDLPLRIDGAAHVEHALGIGRGIVFVTPHMGAFEATALGVVQVCAGRVPLTVLYRRPRQAWLAPLLERARTRPGMEAAPTDMGGVKQMIKALRAGECVGLLPDQVPPLGMGVWADFFGQPAYTMTLAARLVQQTGAAMLMTWAQRLPGGSGWQVHFAPFSDFVPEPLSSQPEAAARQINAAVEGVVRRAPEQYLWGYRRYKQPKAESAHVGR
jgi:Kdo2-lipid IVA lauroyltransferase/acyltransferase